MNFEEFLKPATEESAANESDQATEAVEELAPPMPEELDVQKAVVEELAADKAALDEQLGAQKAVLERNEETITALKTQIENLKNLVKGLEDKVAELQARQIDEQERNPNALALLDRDVELPDRFPGETRDHVLEVVQEARDKAEADGRLRRAQVLEGVLTANEPNGTLKKKRAMLEKLFNDNANVLTGPVLEELQRLGLSHKNGEDYLLPAEILRRTY